MSAFKLIIGQCKDLIDQIEKLADAQSYDEADYFVGRLLSKAGELNVLSSVLSNGPDRRDLKDYGFPNRAINQLSKHGIVSIKQVLKMTDADFLKIRDIGKKTLGKIHLIIDKIKDGTHENLSVVQARH